MAPAPAASTSGKAHADKGMAKHADKGMTKHGDKGMTKHDAAKGDMKKSNNTAAPAASGAK